MNFSYYTVYRTEESEHLSEPYRWMAAAVPFPDAPPGEDTWVFWTGARPDGPPFRFFTFSERREAGDGVVWGRLKDSGSELWFRPLTVDFVRDNASQYPVAGVDLERLTQGDIQLLFHAAEVGDNYENWLGPLAEIVTAEDIRYLGENIVQDLLIEREVFEARGVPAETGTVHRWRDGHDYEKQADASWKRVDTEWRPDHPDVPKSTKAQHFDKNWGWDPHRKKLHAKLLDTVRSNAFGASKPVAAGETPTFTYIMGPPAAGKSTRARGASYDNIVKLDPDEFVERLPEFKKASEVKARNGALSVVDEALALNDVLIDEAKDGRYNFIISGTGSNLGWMERELFPDLKQRGYRINVIMTYVDDLDELLLRSEARGHKSGRFVPPERTRALHSSLPKNFAALTQNKDVNSLVLINSHHQPDGQMANEVAYVQQGEKQEVQQPEFFNSVMEKAS